MKDPQVHYHVVPRYLATAPFSVFPRSATAFHYIPLPFSVPFTAFQCLSLLLTVPFTVRRYLETQHFDGVEFKDEPVRATNTEK